MLMVKLSFLAYTTVQLYLHVPVTSLDAGRTTDLEVEELYFLSQYSSTEDFIHLSL